MPRVPTLQTRTRTSADVPRMQAAPAETATRRAISGLTKTVGNLAVQVAAKQQRQKDSTGEYETSNALSRASSTFESENKSKIDIDGTVEGVDYTEAVRENVTAIQNEQLEKYRGTVSSDAFNRMQLRSRASIDNAVQRADRIQRSTSSRKAIVKGNELVNESSEIAMATGDHLQAYSALQDAGKYQIDRTDNFATPEDAARFGKESMNKISFSLTQGQIANGDSISAIKTAGMSADPEIQALLSEDERAMLKGSPLRDLSGLMTASQKLRVKRQAISAIKTADNLAKTEIKNGLSSVSAGIKLGVMSTEEAQIQMSGLVGKASKLTPEESMKVLGEVSKLSTISNTSEMMDSVPPSEWIGNVNEQLEAMPSATLEDRIVKAEVEGAVKGMMVKREQQIKTDFANYSIGTDVGVKKSAMRAMDVNNPDGFTKFKDTLVSKAKEFNINEKDITIVPAPMKSHYKGIIESDNANVVLEGLRDLEQHVGSQSYAKALMEITKQPEVAVATNFGNPDMSQKYIQTVKDKEFPTIWKNYKQSTGVSNAEEKEAVVEMTSDDFFVALSEMLKTDGGRTKSAHIDAMRTMYQRFRVDGKSDEDAIEAAKGLFVGKDGAYEIAKNSDGMDSLILVPKKNGAGLDAEKVQSAIEGIKEDPFLYAADLNMTAEYIDAKGITAGSLTKEMSFQISQDGTGVVGMGLTGKYLDKDGKQVFISWKDLAAISDRATSKRTLEETALSQAAQALVGGGF